MKIDDVRRMSDQELQAKLTEFTEEKSNLRMKKAVTTLENPNRLQTVRRSIARVKTVLRERELEEAQNGE